MARRERAALDVAARALRARDLSRSALAGRLAAAGFEEADRQDVLARLSKAGFLDDGRLARSRAEHLAERGWGDAGIAARLAADGIGRDEVDAAVAALRPESERASLLARRSRSVPARRLARRLSARGFGEEAIRAALAILDELDPAELR